MARANVADSYEAASRLVRGVRLGRYELLLPIAAGGMGQVWAARLVGSHGFSKLVAIKTILPMLLADAEVEKMFLDEARVAALVHHPNVCQTLELGDDGKTLYMVMEWVDGASFRELVRTPSGGTNPVEFPIAARIMADVCAGLHAAHDLVDESGQPLEVVHRDVSPQNVLLSVDGAVKVTDFGLVRALGRLHVTRASRPKGKVGFMAPEQLAGGTIDRRADIFSAGCVLYEVTTGQPPFPGEGEPQVIARMLIGEYDLPSKLVPDYPPELEAIIVRALEQEPSKRFESADAMHTALEKYLERQPVSAKRLGALVAERCKEIIAARREAIRGAAQKVDENVEATDPGATPVPTAPRTTSGITEKAERAAREEEASTTAGGVSSSSKPEAPAPPARRFVAAGLAFGLITTVGIVAYRMGGAAVDPVAPDAREARPSATTVSGSAAPTPGGSAKDPAPPTPLPQTSADPRPTTVSSGASLPAPSFPTPSAAPKGSSSAAGSASSAPTGSPSSPPGIPTLPNPYPNE